MSTDAISKLVDELVSEASEDSRDFRRAEEISVLLTRVDAECAALRLEVECLKKECIERLKTIYAQGYTIARYRRALEDVRDSKNGEWREIARSAIATEDYQTQDMVDECPPIQLDSRWLSKLAAHFAELEAKEKSQ